MSEQRRKFLAEMEAAASELENARLTFLRRVTESSQRFALAALGTVVQSHMPTPTPTPVATNGGEETEAPVSFGQSHTPTPEPAPPREEEPPRKSKPVLTPEAEALTVYTRLCEKNQAGERWSLETFRGSVRQALELGKIGEERFGAILKAGAAGAYWHKAMDGTKVMVVLGRRPAGLTPTPGREALPAERAGEALTTRVTDWELELRELYESEGKAKGVIDHIVGGLYYQAGCKEDDLHLQHVDVVSALETILKNKVAEVRERHENDAAERALSGEA
jgi:hypothetical protein